MCVNDLSWAGKVQTLGTWWNKINKLGYFLKENKLWLALMPEQYDTLNDTH